MGKVNPPTDPTQEAEERLRACLKSHGTLSDEMGYFVHGVKSRDLRTLLDTVEKQRDFLEYSSTMVALWAAQKAREAGLDGVEYHPHFHEKLEQIANAIGNQRIASMIESDRAILNKDKPHG